MDKLFTVDFMLYNSFNLCLKIAALFKIFALDDSVDACFFMFNDTLQIVFLEVAGSKLAFFFG